MNQLYRKRSSKQLIEAVNQNDEKLVKELLESGINANARDYGETGNGVLYYSVLTNNIEIMKLLLEHGAYVDDVNYGGIRAVDMAFLLGRTHLAEVLLKYGARLNINMYNHAIRTPARRNDVELMYKYIDLRERDRNGLSILHLAAMFGDAMGTETLVKRGASINERTWNDGSTPLHLAAREAKVECVDILLENGAKIDYKDEYGFTAVHAVVDYKGADAVAQITVLRMLLKARARVNERNNDGLTALHIAANNAKVECMKLLLEHGAIATLKDDFGCSPLHRLFNNYDNFDNSDERVVEAIKLLVSAGADIDEPNGDGLTPLHCVTICVKVRYAELLLDCGARPNSKDTFGFTPLHSLTCLRTNEDDRVDQIRIMHMLLDCGANVNDVTNHGKTALMLAMEANTVGVVKALLKYMATFRNRQGRSLLNEKNLQTIAGSGRWSYYYNSCAKEVEKMQNIKIFGELTIFDILTRDTRSLTIYSRNFNIMLPLEDNRNQIYFPIYYRHLKRKYYDILEKKDLLVSASMGLSLALHRSIDSSNIVATQILNLLNLNDLKSLSELLKPKGQ